MSSQTGKFREEQVLVICPGSQTTLAQLGCNELTPPQHRFPTRMFRDEEDENQWRPFHTYKRIKPGNSTAENNTEEPEYEYVEDVDSTEGAVYPIQGGHIVNMAAFLAFLEHVHSALTTTYHNTPIMLMASPQWTRRDCESITGYVFEKTKTPALCLIHSGIATQYGLKWPHMTVVDVGYEKVDVTCIYDGRVVGQDGLGPGVTVDEREGKEREEKKEDISGGEVFTRRLLGLLGDQGFDYEMAEQLKKSNICEVLPYAPESNDLMELPVEGAPAATTTAATGTGAAAPAVGTSTGQGPQIVTTAPPPAAEEDAELNGVEKAVNEEGVLDVASLVVSGQTREFLAKKEKEKAEKAKAGRKGKGQEPESAAAKAGRLPNSKKLKNTFHYEELVTEDVVVAPPPKENGAAATTKDVDMADASAPTTAPTTAPPEEGENPPAPPAEPAAPTAAPETKEEPPTKEEEPSEPVTERQTRRVRRDIEVGLERFQFADRKEIDRIVATIYRTVQSIEDMYMRPSCWENITFVGNGVRLRGLRDNIMQTLQARHLISPSSATIFTSELPSNIGTPSGTGSQTPTGSFTGAPHQLPTSGVNPLLQAATTASLGIPGAAGQGGGDGAAGATHHFHSQTPTNIKLAPLPTYLTEWTKNGFEEAMFLGAQVAARLAFCMHNLDAQGLEAQRLMSLSRVDFK